MVLLNNLVVIAQGAPNQLKDKRTSKCVCAYNLDTKEFCRIYPVPQGWLRRWILFNVEVEKNPRDNRENSWKIKNSKDDWKKMKKHITILGEYPKKDRNKLIESFEKTTLSKLREDRKSFGIIKPKIINFELEQRKEKTTKQTTLSSFCNHEGAFDIINQKDYKYKPYLIYECEGECKCKDKIHRQQIVEWGCYEYMRKYPGKEIDLKENLRLFDEDYVIYLLLGNLHKAPQTYFIIGILRYKKENKK